MAALAKLSRPRLAGVYPRERLFARLDECRLVDREGNHAYYTALIEADARSLEAAGGLRLVAGMPAEVYLKGEERTPLQYLVEPVTQVLRRAGRED